MKCGRKVSVADAIKSGNNTLPTLVSSHVNKEKKIIPRDQAMTKITRVHIEKEV